MNVTSLSAHPFETVESDHVHLRQRLQRLGERLLCDGPSALRAELSDVTQQLEQHFSHEESGDFFAVVVESTPQRSDRVLALMAEHQQFRQFLRELDSLCFHYQSPAEDPEAVAAKYAEFLRLFEAHERAEHELLQEAVGLDHGEGD